MKSVHINLFKLSKVIVHLNFLVQLPLLSFCPTQKGLSC